MPLTEHCWTVIAYRLIAIRYYLLGQNLSDRYNEQKNVCLQESSPKQSWPLLVFKIKAV